MAKKDKQKIYVTAEEIIEYYDMKYFSNAIWLLKNKAWETLSIHSNAGYQTAYLKAQISDYYQVKFNEIPKDEKELWRVPRPHEQIDTGTIIGITMNTKAVKEIFKGIVFKNGYVKVDGKGFQKCDKPPFTTMQINRDYNSEVKPNKVFNKWFNTVTGKDKDVQKKYLTLWSYGLSSETLGVLMYQYGPGGIGKSEVTQKIADYAGRENHKKIKSGTIFGRQAINGARFALRGVNDRSMLFMDEFIKEPNSEAGNTFKGLMNQNGYMEYEDKRSNDTETPNTHSWFATANHYPKFKDMDPWVEERIVIAELLPVDLPSDELEQFMNGEYVPYLIKLLVSFYTHSSKYRNKRNTLLKVERFQRKWLESSALKSDEEIWALEAGHELDNKTMANILAKYAVDTNKRSNMNKMGRGLLEAGFYKKENARPRTYQWVGDVKEQEKVVN